MNKNAPTRGFGVLYLTAAMWGAGVGSVASIYAADQAPANAPSTAAPAPMNPAEIPANATDKEGKTGTDATGAPAAKEIRKTVGDVTDAAVKPGGFKDVVANFVDADRKRLAAYTPTDALDTQVEALRKDWKEKYAQDFSFPKDANAVLGDAFGLISQGEIGKVKLPDGKVVASVEPRVNTGAADDLKKAGVSNPDANSEKFTGGDTNRNPGRNIAAVMIPPTATTRDLAVPMIHELPNNWRIDLPDTTDGQKLQDNLAKALAKVDADRANWPADPFEAYRIVSRQVLGAILEADAPR